jgi:RNA polymerase sigma factor (sigma-70 family)
MKEINGVLTTKEDAVVNNMKLVYKLSRKYYSAAKMIGLDPDDLHHIGAIGIMRAYDKYDPSTGHKFSTLAGHYIGFTIKDEFYRKNANITGFSNTTKVLAYKIRKDGNQDCSLEEIMKLYECKEKQAQLVMDCINFVITSLDKTVSDEEDSTSYHGFNSVEDDTSSIFVKEFLETLTPMECEVVELTSQGLSQADIGHLYGVSRTRIWQILELIREKYLKYQAGVPLKKVEKEELSMIEVTQEQYLALKNKEVDGKKLTEKEIAEELGMSTATLWNKKSKWKMESKDLEVQVDVEAVPEVNWKAKCEEIQEQNEKLLNTLNEKIKLILKLEEEVDRLENSPAKESRNIDVLVSDYEMAIHERDALLTTVKLMARL